jgi:flavin-dependent dehydrogenase
MTGTGSVRDVVVVGGGPGGLAAACEAARRGLRATLLEQHDLPRAKACGEGLLPTAVEALRDLGVRLPEAASSPILGLRYVDAGGVATGRFRGRAGLGAQRLVLSRALLGRALELGVDVRTGVRVTGVAQTASGVEALTDCGAFRGSWLVAADGLASRVREMVGIGSRRGPARFGSRRHYRARGGFEPFVEVHWGERVEAYVTPVGAGQVGVALLWWADVGRPHRGFLAEFPALACRLEEPTDGPRGAGPFDVRVERRAHGRVLLVGDAAGYVDALTGEGVGLALEGARAAIGSVARGQPELYESWWGRATRRHRIATRSLLAVARRPRLRGVLMAAARRFPGLLEQAIGLAVAPVPRLGARGPESR